MTTFLTRAEQSQCTCGLVGPFAEVREYHLTTCALEGNEPVEPEDEDER